MKKYNIILMTLFFVLPLASCKKYLEVVPKTQMPQNVLFSSENGFKDALTGVYIQMKNNSSYGGRLTQTTIEYLVSSWDVTSNTTEQRIGLFNFADSGVESNFSEIFAHQYTTIASINAILSQIESRKEVFTTTGMYETIKSEALALRAYCHLDLLRLFGPIPTNPANGNTLAYVTTLSKTPTTRIPFTQFQEALLKDLAEAEQLVKDIDPITKFTLAELRNPSITGNFNPSDLYFAYRYLRMNYYAIKGLQARAYLWFGDKQKAYENAKFVIDAKNNDGSAKFRLGTSADMATNKDFVLSSEHIFGLYDFDMYNKYTINYGSGAIRKGTAATTINTSLYGNTGTDIREANLWELITLANQSKAYVLKKYLPIEKPTNLSTDFKQIPMLRLSEMYLIAAETAPSSEAQNYWTTFKTARNITTTTLPTDPTQLQFEILKEIRKEFYGEGQAFFAYKRVNAPKANYLFAPTAATVNYLIPLPNAELASN